MTNTTHSDASDAFAERVEWDDAPDEDAAKIMEPRK